MAINGEKQINPHKKRLKEFEIRIKHLETESSTLIYNHTSAYFYLLFIYLAYLALARYKHHLGVTGWAGVEDSLDERGRIRKTTLDFLVESRDKISVETLLKKAFNMQIAVFSAKIR